MALTLIFPGTCQRSLFNVSVMLTTSYMSVALLSITNRSINHFNNTQVYSSDTQRLLWFSPFWHLHPSIPFVSKQKFKPS